jgi:putative transposase
MLYIKYGSISTTINDLQYPSARMLRNWFVEYTKTGNLKKVTRRKRKYNSSQIDTAIDHYLSHGKCLARTSKSLGYPHIDTLRKWVRQRDPGMIRSSDLKGPILKHEHSTKENSVLDLLSNEDTGIAIASRLSISRTTLYKWKDKIIDRKKAKSMKKSTRITETIDTGLLVEEISQLKQNIRKLRIEKEMLEIANEKLKK